LRCDGDSRGAGQVEQGVVEVAVQEQGERNRGRTGEAAERFHETRSRDPRGRLGGVGRREARLGVAGSRRTRQDCDRGCHPGERRRSAAIEGNGPEVRLKWKSTCWR
jgi:hypothetical protein